MNKLSAGYGLAFDEDRQIPYLVTSLALYTLDTSDRQASLIGLNGVDGIDGLAWTSNTPLSPALYLRLAGGRCGRRGCKNALQ